MSVEFVAACFFQMALIGLNEAGRFLLHNARSSAPSASLIALLKWVQSTRTGLCGGRGRTIFRSVNSGQVFGKCDVVLALERLLRTSGDELRGIGVNEMRPETFGSRTNDPDCLSPPAEMSRFPSTSSLIEDKAMVIVFDTWLSLLFIQEAGSDVTNTPPPEPADVTNTSLPEQADVTSTPGAPPPPSATPGHSKIPPPTAFRNFFDDDEDSSPPLRVNRRRRPNAEQGGVPLGTELPPLDVDSSARTAFGGFGRIQTEGAERGFVGDGLAQPGSERGLTGGLDAGLRRATIEGPKGGLHLDGGAQEGDIRKTLFGGVNLARDSTPVWRAESGRGFGAGEAECRVDGAGGPLAEDRVPVEGVPLRRSDDRPTEPAPSGTGRGIETNAAAEAERDVRSVERCTPVVTAFFQGDISEDIRSGGAEGRNDGTTERQDGTKEPEASVCGEQSNAEVSSRGERVPREEVSSGAKSRLGGLDGAGEPRHVEAADLLSMGPEAQPWKSCGDWKAAGMVDGAPASGRLDGMERNQTESDGSGRSPAEWRGLGRNRTEPEASGWGSMDLGGSDHFPPEPRGPAWNPTEVGGTGLNRTCSGGFGPSKHFGQACTGHRGGFAGTPDFVSRVEEPGKRGSKQETAGPPSRRLSSSNESERFEWAADALRNPTPPRLPKSSLVSQTPPRLPKFPRPSPFSAEDRSTALFERPQSPPAAVLPPSRGDELFGGVRGDAFPGGVDVPLLEAERLQEENHPGAILSLLGEEVEVLIDAFAIWREKAQQYHTAKAVGYDPPSHCHKVKYLADDKEEWVALWREDVKILVWGEDYTEPDDIPVCLDRNGRKGPVKRRKVEPIKAQNDVKRREKKKERSCGAASEEEGPESEVDNEFLPDEDEVIDDGVGDVSAGRRRRAAAARDTAGAAEFEQRWRVAVENGPQTFHFLFENVAHANRGQAAMGPDGELEERENVWDFMQRHLWGIPPEEINSVEFSVANRKRK